MCKKRFWICSRYCLALFTLHKTTSHHALSKPGAEPHLPAEGVEVVGEAALRPCVAAGAAGAVGVPSHHSVQLPKHHLRLGSKVLQLHEGA